ncbi:hypothetical protein [Paenibacillus prosopidis]|uniref:hypothetical protein n=1 Tax=Paenibacillus prosopidis TaxID=630520 RepID=UPI0015F1332B|nr:hypothetical protein [Paenibacillus prosopidis]
MRLNENKDKLEADWVRGKTLRTSGILILEKCNNLLIIDLNNSEAFFDDHYPIYFSRRT